MNAIDDEFELVSRWVRVLDENGVSYLVEVPIPDYLVDSQ